MRRNTLAAIIVLVLILGALAAKSLLISVPPVRAHNAPGQFDAARAKARLARVLGDQRPHPADSDANDAVRSRIVAELRAIGLNPIVRDQVACNDFQKARLVACARVHNVIAMLGPAQGKALLLDAHYDSVPVGPGAGDDGIGVATLLEVGAILKDRPLRHPVILLFNEGEELGLVGARAFLADPLSCNVDRLLNFDARGVTGPVTMFETSGPNGPAISAFVAVAPHPSASSLSTDIAKLIPNDTDMTVFKERGWLGLNFAIMGNETRYHSSGDNLAALDTRSLQDMGDQALAVASRLSDGAPQPSATRIFMPLLDRAIIQMPLVLGIVLLLLLLGVFGAIAWRRRALVHGSGMVLGAMIAGGALAYLTITAIGLLRPGIYWRAHPETTFVAIYATILAGATITLRYVGPRLRTEQLRAAYWLVFLTIGGLLALIAPGAIIYFLIPPTAVLIGIAVSKRYRFGEAAGGLVALLLLYVLWGETLQALEELFSPGPLATVVPVAAIMILPALIEAEPIFRRASRRLVLLGSTLIALLIWLVAGTSPAYSDDRQQRFTIEHVTEFPSRRSSWSVLNDGTRLPPTYERAGPWREGKLPFSDRRRWLAPAPHADNVLPPTVQLLETVRNGGERVLRVRLHSNGAHRILFVAPADAHIRAAGVSGFVRPLGSQDSFGRFTVACTGRSCDGMELTIDQASIRPTVFTVVGARNGLPPAAAPLVQARPRFARPQYTPDETIAIARFKV